MMTKTMPLGDGSLAPVVTGLAPSSSVVTSGSPSRHRFQSSAPTVFVGMSGGVDSSVAALLLVEQGYNVTGVYMKNWSQDLPGMKCPWADDLADAKRVAVKLGIPFEVWDFEKEYREKVVEYMLAEFKKGNTPNPDIMCNQEIKFKLFFEKAMERGADFIATGHYARATSLSQLGAFRSAAARELAREPRGDGRERRGPEWDNEVALLRAADENKDQTYFLYRISDGALAKTLFPIGDMLKPEVKKLAEEKGLHNAYKKESMGVCFVGEVGMKDFLKEYIDTKPGEIRRVEDDKVLGVHEGAVFYTIGQRHGLYLDGEKGTVNDGLPYYVVKKDIPNNIVYVSKNLNDNNLWVDELELADVVLRTTDNLQLGAFRSAAARELAPAARGDGPAGRGPECKLSGVQVRLRHRAPLIPAKFDGEKLYFDSKIKRPASGQSAVIYVEDICLGGGIIV